MSDPALQKWVAELARKHGFGGSSTATAPSGGGTAPTGTAAPSSAPPATAPTGSSSPSNAPSAPTPSAPPATPTSTPPAAAPAPAGSGAKAQADAAEAAAAKAEGVSGPLKAVATEAQTAAQDAQKHKQEASTSLTTVNQAVQGIAAAPKVGAPQGADPKARYDSAIQITGTVRKAQADVQVKATEARDQELAADTAAKNAATKADESQQKASKARSQSDEAAQHAQAAADAAKQAASDAATSKSAADKAAKDDPNKAALQKTAQEDAQHAARAKAAAARAIGAAKQAATSATGAESQAKLAQTAKGDARKDADAVKKALPGIDAKLAPYDQAVSQAETQEADCKAKAGDDAQSVLEKRYEALGGDAELSKALAAEDKELELSVEAARTKGRTWQKERVAELDEQKAKHEPTVKLGEQYNSNAKTWLAKEEPELAATKGRAGALGEKLKTEPGKEAQHELSSNEARIERTKKILEFNTKVVEQTQEMLKTLTERYADIDKAYEAFEKFLGTVTAELDNELELGAMSLEQKVDFLQTRPKPVRDRVQKRLENYLSQVLAASVAVTAAEKAEFQEGNEPGAMSALDWAGLKAKLDKLESTTLEVLQGADPKLEDIRKEYEAAGGDKALFDKRLAQWKTEVAARDAMLKEKGDTQRSQRDTFQTQLDEAIRSIKLSQSVCADIEAAISADEQRKKELVGKLDPVNLTGLTEQERAELKLIDRRIQKNQQQLAGRKEMLEAQQKSKADIEKQREQSKAYHEHQIDDDSRPALKKPESADVHAMPLRAKYTELTGKPAPA